MTSRNLLVILLAISTQHVRANREEDMKLDIGHLALGGVEAERARKKKKCTITGPSGESVSLPIKKGCRTGCSATGLSPDEAFSKAFEPEMDITRDVCVCSVDSKPILQFPAPSSNNVINCRAMVKTAEHVQNLESQGKDTKITSQLYKQEKQAAREECWASYTRARSTIINNGIVKVDLDKFALNTFTFSDNCEDCKGSGCVAASIPGLLQGWPRDMLLALYHASKNPEDSRRTKADNHQMRLFKEMLVLVDTDRLDFIVMDADEDGSLDMSELVGFYDESEEKVAHWQSASIEFEEFRQFREKMRNYVPTTTTTTTTLPPVFAWKAFHVGCTKDGVQVDDSLCEQVGGDKMAAVRGMDALFPDLSVQQA